MSIGNTNNDTSGKIGTPIFHEFKKQASFFFKEKIKTARLALTDVTPAELLTEEATNGNTWAPDAQTLKIISRAAFEVDDYWRIVEILHKRLTKFDKNNWRVSYNAVIVLEHLLTHGPESASEEFQSDADVIKEMQSFQHIDEKGFNWGLTVRKKSDRILKLLEKGPLLKEERQRARKLTRGIEGFGSFCQRSSTQGILGQSGPTYNRSNSQFQERGNDDDGEIFQENDENLVHKGAKEPNDDKAASSWFGVRLSFKENVVPPKSEVIVGETNPLLGSENIEKMVEKFGEDHHPFSGKEKQASDSLLSIADHPLQAC